MRDWKKLEQARVTYPAHGIPECYVSDSSYGFNGLFRLNLRGCFIRCIASDGEGWRHVSVSIERQPNSTPTWQMMCDVKDLFFDDEDVVLQFHPRKSEYVNNHKGCLHLWQPWKDGKPEPFPTPAANLVGVL